MEIEVFWRVGEQGGATGRGGHIDDAVRRAESLEAHVDEVPGSIGVGHVREREDCGGAELGELRCENLSAVDRSAAQDKAGRSLLNEPAGDCFAEPLCSSIDDGDAHGRNLVLNSARFWGCPTTGSMLRSATSRT